VKALLLYLLPVCIAMQPATIEAPQNPNSFYSFTVKKSFFRLGSKVITLNKFISQQQQPFLMVNLHNDEESLIDKAKEVLAIRGGQLVVLENQGNKLIEAEVLDRMVVFDPSHIFTNYGRKFKPKKGVNFKIDQHVRQFADFITNELDDGKNVVDLHSHSEQDKPISHYKKELRKFKDVKAVHHNAAMDEGDYFLTSDEDVFEKLKSRGFNVVLQSSTKLKELGMLDDFCQKMKSKYLLLATRTGHGSVQELMLNALYEVF
jgi:hypothetical protein